MRLPESQQDAVTALSGSGPAYFFYLVEAMIDAGILLGLPRAVAAELIVQSAYGAAVMMRESGDHPVILREAVTSPAGTTIAAVRELERHSVRAALMAAIEAARDRSVELGAETSAKDQGASDPWSLGLWHLSRVSGGRRREPCVGESGVEMGVDGAQGGA